MAIRPEIIRFDGESIETRDSTTFQALTQIQRHGQSINGWLQVSPDLIASATLGMLIMTGKIALNH
jgi:hypothetical protein